jgi:hypothetical protein
MPDKTPLIVYAIEDNGGDRKSWREIGVAFRCAHQSLNVKLYMLPLLKINIREQPEGDPERVPTR